MNNVVPFPQPVQTKANGFWHDAAVGPCECGAWHSPGDWAGEKARVVFQRDPDETHYVDFDAAAFIEGLK